MPGSEHKQNATSLALLMPGEVSRTILRLSGQGADKEFDRLPFAGSVDSSAQFWEAGHAQRGPFRFWRTGEAASLADSVTELPWRRKSRQKPFGMQNHSVRDLLDADSMLVRHQQQPELGEDFMLSIGLQQARFRAEKLGLSTALTAKLIGVSSTSLSNAYRGVGQLSSEKEAVFGSKMRILERFHDALSPLRLPQDILLLDELTVSEVTPEEAEALMKRMFPYFRG